MTPEERAEKICAGVEDYLHSKGHYHFGFELLFRKTIAEQIREAVDEAEKAIDLRCEAVYDEGTKEAKAEAFEEAAKILDLEVSKSRVPGSGWNNGALAEWLEQLAAKIRARAKEVGE